MNGSRSDAAARRAAAGLPAAAGRRLLRWLLADRRIPGIAVITLVAVATLAAAVSRATYPTAAEVQAVAVGRSVLAGLGPVTAFGGLAVTTSPLFGLLLVSASRLLGVDPYTVGRVIAIASLAVLLVASYLLARDAGRWGAVLAVAAVVAWLVPLELARSARVDELAAALSIAYLPLAMRAAHPGDERRPELVAILAGVTIGVAVLLDPRALALAPVPALSALATGAPVRRVLRAGSLTLLAGLATTATWFAWDAALTGRIDAIGLSAADIPAVTLVTIGAASAAFVVSLLPGASASARRDRRRLLDRPLRSGGYIAAVLLVVWTLAILATLVRPDVLHGRPLVSFPALRRYLAEWLPALLPVGIVGLGAIASLDPIMDGERPGTLAAAGLVSVMPSVVVAVATDAPPTALVVPAVLLVALAVTGWVRLAGRWRNLTERGRIGGAVLAGLLVALEILAVVRQHAAHGGPALVAAVLAIGVLGGLVVAVLPGLVRRRGAGRLIVPVAGLLLVAVAASAAGASAVVGHRQADRLDVARAAASSQVVAWLRTNVPPGSTIVLAPLDAEQLAVLLDGQYRLGLLGPTIASLIPDPLTLSTTGAPLDADWLALGLDPSADALDGYRASAVRAVLDGGPAVIVDLGGPPGSTPSLVGALRATPGVVDVLHRTWRVRGGPLALDVFRVDARPHTIPADRVYVDAAALDRIAAALEGTEAGRLAADRLEPRLSFWPPSPDDAVALSRLQRVASAAQ